MADHGKNRLLRIIEIQNITLEHTRRGVTQKWIYENIVYPRFYITSRTYYNYLAFNAKKALRELEQAEGKQ